MRVCPVCGSPVMTWIEVSAEQDEEGYWHPITEYKGTTVSQQDIDTSCEADGNYCACTNPHCGIPLRKKLFLESIILVKVFPMP